MKRTLANLTLMLLVMFSFMTGMLLGLTRHHDLAVGIGMMLTGVILIVTFFTLNKD